jgi:glycosyltransferase involved in cell wall biosynthesis
MKLYKWTRVFDDVDTFICTCDFTKQKLVEGGIYENKIKVIPTFIDASTITPCYENDKYFLCLGRMAHQKGTIYAIEAMKYIRDTEYVIKITGTPGKTEEDQKIIEFIEKNGLENKVVFTGFKKGKELDELIDRCTAVVCPAIWYENMPNTVIEAYAHGKPVIASRIGSLAEIVDDGKTGFLFEMKNSRSLADKYRKLIDDRDLAEAIGKNAREKVVVDYCLQKHMNEVMKTLS